MMKRAVVLIGALACVGAFFWVIVAADQAALPAFLIRLYQFPGGDKVGHLVVMAILTVAINLLTGPKKVRGGLVGTVIALLLITAEEGSQAFFPSRTFSLLDLLFSYAGALIADKIMRWRGR